LVRCSEVEYLNSRDATIMGSRNGHAPIYMWYTLTLKGYEGMRRDVEKCLRNAHLLQVCHLHLWSNVRDHRHHMWQTPLQGSWS
jgi:hypothetical protein